MKNIITILLIAMIAVLSASEIETKQIPDTEGFQTIEMKVDRHGWTPNSFVLKKNIPVQWKINAEELTYCNESIVIPGYDMKIELKKGEQIVEFTPLENGEVTWSCWMDMIPGKFTVTEDGKSPETQTEISDE